jgi:hypothetical protein
MPTAQLQHTPQPQRPTPHQQRLNSNHSRLCQQNRLSPNLKTKVDLMKTSSKEIQLTVPKEPQDD